MKTIKRIITSTLDRLAPYTVQCPQFPTKTHYCWTWADAHEWIRCYDVGVFGRAVVHVRWSAL